MGNKPSLDLASCQSSLTNVQRKAIRESWATFCSTEKDPGEVIFVTMFVKHPNYLQLFPLFRNKPLKTLRDTPEFKAHARAVGYQLSAIVDTLSDPPIVAELIRKNAANHLSRKGVMPQHFRSLCEVVVDVLEEALESKMTEAISEAWAKLFKEMMLITKSVYRDAQKGAEDATITTLQDTSSMISPKLRKGGPSKPLPKSSGEVKSSKPSAKPTSPKDQSNLKKETDAKKPKSPP